MRLYVMSTAAAAGAMFVAGVPVAARAQSTGLDDMVGARAGQAEGELQRRGYRNTGGQPGDDRSYTFWWSDARRQCVTIATMDGRYASITPSPAPDCRQPAGRPTTLPNRPGENRPVYRPDERPTTLPNYPGENRPVYRPGDRPTTLPSRPPVIGGQPVQLGLVCFGDGSRDGIGTGTRWTWNAERDHYDYGSYTETQRQSFDASLMIQLWDGGGRIRLPKSLIPPINSRGNSG